MPTLQVKEILCLIYSAILFLTGGILIGFAIVLSYKVLFYHFSFISNNTIGPFIVLLVVGILHLLVTWIGVKGPSKEHDFFIIMFVIIAILLLAIEMSVGIWSLVLRSKVEEGSLTLMKKSQVKYIQEYTMGKERSEWVRLQTKFECCGIHGPHDYEKVPISCYKCQHFDVLNKTRMCFETHQIGCKEPLVGFMRKLLLQVSILGLLTALMQIVGVYVFVDFYRHLRVEKVRRVAERRAQYREATIGRDLRRSEHPGRPPPVDSGSVRQCTPLNPAPTAPVPLMTIH